MSTWRDVATDQAEDDIDRLVLASRAMGDDALNMDDFIRPFGVGLTVAGEIEWLEGDSQVRHVRWALTALLAEAVRSAETLSAVAFAFAALMDEGGPGLEVVLIHREGSTCRVSWLDEGGRLHGGCEDQAMWATKLHRCIWPLSVDPVPGQHN